MIAVYGANGFIGCHLVRALVRVGMPVRAVSRRIGEAFRLEFERAVDIVEADLGNQMAVCSSLTGVDTVVQLMSTSAPSMGNEQAIADIEANVIPHVRFLRSCMEAGVRRLVFLSSGGAIYGPGASTPTPEDAPARPISSHGVTKLMVEKYIEMYAATEGIEFVTLRLANPFGPGQEFRKGQGLVPAVLDCVRHDRPVKVFGAGLALRDYLYIDDVIEAISTACLLRELPSVPINIGSGQPRSIMEVLAALEKVLGAPIPCEFICERKTDVEVSWLDITRAKEMLDWQPATPFDEGIQRTVERLRHN